MAITTATMETISAPSMPILCAVILMSYWASIVIYRLYFHPLARFPGPRRAAATHLYEIAWDYFGDGGYLFEVQKMHQKYGPIVRVNPLELSILDPDFYAELYVTGSVRRTEAFPHFGDGMDFNGSHGMTVDHDLHRRRRKPMEPFFSRQGVSRIEPKLSELVCTLVGRLQDYRGTGKVIRLDHALSALAGDVISNICMDDPPASFLHDPDFNPHWFELFHTLIRSMPIFMNFSWIIKIVRLIPESILRKLDPRSQMFRDWRIMSENHIAEAKNRKLSDGSLSKSEGYSRSNTVFDQLVNSDMSESDLSVERLASEAQVLMGAGTVTTARSMDHLTVHILRNSRVQDRLEAELKEVMADFPETLPSWKTLDQLPYLQACIKEGLRLSHGIMHRLPRCSPDVALQYKEWTIPRGTPVGMSAYYMHTDPEVYINPFEFRPERWLGEINPNMHRNYVPFTKGSRNCLGINLAYAEMSMVMAALFCPKGPKLKLFATDERDADPACAFLLPLPKLDSKGIRVLVE
ncbi:related to cytochrome P450 CYP3/CYP5/CYP6/CYP9 subfamilies [Rhynchosporium secalis]|uniref:Related to cytochrome P450 CYP3/CYP5/CYP6/CYP9 subfamilies n=1 Tax=Rhynchosporium secalis TaxID=38038 RepID=A0A1E1MJ28_RHYSE|nr:related to cytochrome P450 CYP3/CYP5/CYP6/CYP9 subfamilies [Rhynchosporium secalis]